MKRLGSLVIISSVLLLAACNSELEVVHNETYYGAKEEDKVLKKPIEVVEETQDDTTEEKVEAPKEDNSSIRKELEKRAEELQEKEEASATQPTTPKEAPKAETKKETPKKQEVVAMKPSNENVKDWKSAINKISNEKIDHQAKIRKLTTFKDKYVEVVTDKEVQQFKQTLLNDFEMGQFTEAIGNDQNMLIYLFKSEIVTKKTSKQNNYSLYMFMYSFNAFLEDIYLTPNSLSEDHLNKQIDKLLEMYDTIK